MEISRCETCGDLVYGWGTEASPQGGYCDECGVGVCARPGCAAKAPEVCCEECPIRCLCWDCASLAWCPEWPPEIVAALRAAAKESMREYNRIHANP